MTGADLKAARIERGLTQAQLAEVLGTTPNTVARWERGEMAIRSPWMLEASLTALRRPRPKKRPSG